MVSHDLRCSTVTNQIAFDQPDLYSTPEFEDTTPLPGVGFQIGNLRYCTYQPIALSIVCQSDWYKANKDLKQTDPAAMRRQRAWKIRKRCQGFRSRAKYLAAKKFHFKFLVLTDCVE